MRFYGIDTEASCMGKTHEKGDVHTVQVCSNVGEHTGRVFWNPQDFKEWYFYNVRPRPRIFYAYTLPFEFGSLAAWELLDFEDGRGRPPWQHWADEPINLFYIKIGRTRVPVFDIRIFFYQLRYGNNYLTSLRALGDFLSDFYGEDVHKLETPLPEHEFGKRPPRTRAEIERFERYGIRDAYICAKAAQWVHENIINKWFNGQLDIRKIYSFGTVARHYFTLPKINKIKRYGKKVVVEFPNLWHRRIYESTYAGRSEAFYTGNVGRAFYNDVSSLYPVSIIKTQCLLIKNVTESLTARKDTLLGRASWERFYEATGYPYGWVLGDFRSNDDLWALPVKVGDNNWYVTGVLKNALYNILDLQSSNAEVMNVDRVLVPVFDKSQPQIKRMARYEMLAKIKLYGEYKSQIEKYFIKNTVNALSGVIGASHPFGAHTNIPAYNTLLAMSHLFMSRIFHKYHSRDHPILYTDTDSFFWHAPVNQTVEQCEPFPDLPFQTLDTVPLKVELKAESRPEGCVIFRGKMYYQNENSFAFSGWKPFPQYYVQIVKNKLTNAVVERQISRKWRTRDKRALSLRVGRWFIVREHWNLAKIKEIFRADDKRVRSTYDSYQLFLDGKKVSSRAPTTDDVFNALNRKKWEVAVLF